MIGEARLGKNNTLTTQNSRFFLSFQSVNGTNPQQ